MIEWIKKHPYLSGGLVLLLIVAYVLYENLSSSASASTSAGANVVSGTGAPSDAIQAAEIASNTQIAQSTLAANAQIAGFNASLNAAALQGQTQTTISNDQTQAALTLGLAQNGNTTPSILELLGAQPGASPVTAGLINPSLLGPTSPGSAPVTPGQPITPAPVGLPPISTPAAPVVTNVPQTQPQPSVPTGATIAAAGGANDPVLYESDPVGVDTETGQTYGVNPQYYATPSTTSQFASILGLQAGTQQNVVGAEGGPFVSPAESTLTVPGAAGQPAGPVDAGQLISELQNTAPGEWGTILGGYGVSMTPAEQNQIYNLFGANQAVPETSNQTSNNGG